MFPECMRTSRTDDWATPSYVFDHFNQKYGFTLDVCANEKNHKCARYFTAEDDGLAQDWTKDVCWMNPPYGRQIGEWIKKAKTSGDNGATVVFAGERERGKELTVRSVIIPHEEAL